MIFLYDWRDFSFFEKLFFTICQANFFKFMVNNIFIKN